MRILVPRFPKPIVLGERVMRVCFTFLAGLLFGACTASLSPLAGQEKPVPQPPAIPPEVERALDKAGPNRAELEKALKTVPAEQRKGLIFLLANMPTADLRQLRADFLLKNVALAYQARREAPWGRQLPEEIFLNEVLPYANVDEPRHPWRKELRDLCRPLIKDCKTPAEAAQRLNARLFPKLKVRFSTARKRANQSPKETIEQGKASCSGLSILLADACRSVAVPARLAGTPLWVNRSGNHTWVEIWDRDWHFTGAAEPDARGLDHAWFEANAAQAKNDPPTHAIYAVSFRRTKLVFPLVWAPHQKDVYAENVTARYAHPARAGLSARDKERVEQAAAAFFAAKPKQQSEWKDDAALDRLLVDHEEEMRQIVWRVYREAAAEAVKKDFAKNQVRFEKHLSPYVVKKVGKRPERGWPLFIALHGGGGAPKAVNDSQWKHMQIYYRDQSSVTGYQYLALRAPNDTWNGFYDDYVPPLIETLICQLLVLGDVDPNKVYLMGYSHGGYGAFFVGPKVPDRFAAVHSSAAAPTDGTISPRTLRNLRFTFMVGEKDNAYGRRERCEAFNTQVQKLRAENKGDYPVEMELKKGIGHTGLPDRDKIKELYAFTRNPVPRHVTWVLTDSVVSHFYWLSVPIPTRGPSIDARINDNHVEITTQDLNKFSLHLDGRLIAFAAPVKIRVDGREQTLQLHPSYRTLCQSLLERGDPALAYTCQVSLQAGK